MNFFKTKISFLILFSLLLPIVISFIMPDRKNNESNLTVKVFDCESNNLLTMSENDYIIGVVSAEMPADFEAEALKAQALAARTYLRGKGKCDNHPEADICTNSAHCQAYKSREQLKQQWGSEFNSKYNKIKNAVESTSEKIITYDGKPISAVFHSTSSGQTENSEDVWEKSLPYLKSVSSTFDKDSPKYDSQKQYDWNEFQKIILSADSGVDFDKGIGDIKTSKGGAIKEIEIGGVKFKGTKIRELFSLNSANFTIDIVDGSVIFTVHGYGHGVGMSQYGANFMAKDGKKYDEIIKHYYTGVKITNE